MDPVVLSWSGGKDSAMALRALRAEGRDVAALLTTVTREHDRVSIHGVRRELLEAQAAAAGLPLTIAEISAGASNDDYEMAMRAALAPFAARGIGTVAFGDLFLTDVRLYREALVASVGMRAVFPIWGRSTIDVAREVVDVGFRAVVVCVDTEALDAGFAGRPYDAALLADLPPGVDPCGENGEFHTFVTAGPGLARDISFRHGTRVLRDERFMFHDLVPVARADRAGA